MDKETLLVVIIIASAFLSYTVGFYFGFRAGKHVADSNNVIDSYLNEKEGKP